MRTFPITLQRPLSRRLMPLVYALLAMVALILALTWVALQTQVALAGFLNGESVWSKAQKQAVVDLDAYASSGSATDLRDFQRNLTVLNTDRWARDNIISGHYDYDATVNGLRRANAMPTAIPGVIFMLHHFSDAPYMRDALQAWRSTDNAVAE
jgi:hypothetical protein